MKVIEQGIARNRTLQLLETVKTEECLYFLALLCYLPLRFGFQYVLPSSLMLLCVFPLALKAAVFTRYNLHEVVISIVAICISVLTYRACGQLNLLYFTLFVVSAKGVPFKKIVKYIFVIGLITMLAVITGSLVGVLPNNYQLVFNGTLSSTVVVNMFCYSNPNVLGRLVLALYMIFLYLRFEKLTVADVIIALVVFGFQFFYLVSRTSAIAGLAAFIIALAYPLLGKRVRNKAFLSAIAIVAILISALFAYAVIEFNQLNSLYQMLNDATSNRVRLYHDLARDYPIKLFGQWLPVDEAVGNFSENHTIIDNSYFRILYHYGLVPFLFSCLIYAVLLIAAIKRRRLDIVLLVSITLIAATMESVLFRIENMGFVALLVFESVAVLKGGCYTDEVYEDCVATPGVTAHSVVSARSHVNNSD